MRLYQFLNLKKYKRSVILGKSKKRIFNKGKNERFENMSRQTAIQTVIELLKNGDKSAYALITLFGLTAEEILEGGASYELVKGMENILK